MSGSNGEAPLVPVAELFRQALDIFRVKQNTLDDLNQFLSRIGQSEQSLAFAHEQFDT